MSETKLLTQMNKPDLLDAALTLEAELAAERASHAEDLAAHAVDAALWEAERNALEAEVAKAKATRSDPFVGTVPVELWVGGASWNGTERRLIRCQPSDETSEWMVRVGDKLVCNDGRQTIQAKPYHQLSKSLQQRVRWPLAKALEIARGR